jgi:RNA polymerase sigma factor (sigma-70 family)
MRPRQQLTEQFASFLVFQAESQSQWVISAPLRRNLEQQRQHLDQPPDDEAFWVTYWYQRWASCQDSSSSNRSSNKHPPQPSLAAEHLCAYLQEACFWGVQSLSRGFQSSQFQLADFFQTAIAQFEKVLRQFKPDYYPSLATYAQRKFKNLTIDRLRQQKEVEICSPWSLLRKLSAKQVREALAQHGLSASDSRQRQQLWHLYKTLWAAHKPEHSRTLTRPTAALLLQLAQTYSDIQSQQAGFPVSPPPAKQVEQWLLELAQAGRNLLYPPATSLNQSLGEDSSTEYQDLLADDASDLSWSQLIQQETLKERQQQRQAIQAVLTQSIAQLPPTDRTLLERYYRQDCTQQSIAQDLGLKQYQIARYLSRIRRRLLQDLVAWATNSLHIAPNSTVVDTMEDALKAWLPTYF